MPGAEAGLRMYTWLLHRVGWVGGWVAEARTVNSSNHLLLQPPFNDVFKLFLRESPPNSAALSFKSPRACVRNILCSCLVVGDQRQWPVKGCITVVIQKCDETRGALACICLVV